MACGRIAAALEKINDLNPDYASVALPLLAFALSLASVLASAQGASARLPKGFTEKIINVDGVKINYKIGGRGPVVVLLHGYTQTSHMWIPLMPLLAASHTVIAPDLR